MGDVNPGAEIVAEGNIIIWGRLRGVAHAGVKDKREAVICALDFSPMQFRIADEAASATTLQGDVVPQIARIDENGKILVENWSAGS
jgi:septum site-determining protein MinC